MKKQGIIVLGLLVIILSGSTPAPCQSSGSKSAGSLMKQVTWAAETDFNTAYIWRGINYNSGLVVQPNVSASWKNFTATVWGNISAWDRKDISLKHEVDVNLNYSWSIGNLQIDNALMFYFYPNVEHWPPTGEALIALGYEMGDFRPFTNAYIDFLTYAGSLYLEHGINYETAFSEKLSVSGSLLFGWGNGKFYDTYMGPVKTSANLFTFHADLTYVPFGSFYIVPHIDVSKTLNKEVTALIGKYPWYTGILIGMEL
jgi:hypothetical protein